MHVRDRLHWLPMRPLWCDQRDDHDHTLADFPRRSAECVVITCRARRPDFNAENREVPARYVDLRSCHYIVDMAVQGQSETRYDLHRGWDIVAKRPFLDVSRSRFPFKTFYLPFLSASRNYYNDYFCEGLSPSHEPQCPNPNSRMLLPTGCS